MRRTLEAIETKEAKLTLLKYSIEVVPPVRGGKGCEDGGAVEG